MTVFITVLKRNAECVDVLTGLLEKVLDKGADPLRCDKVLCSLLVKAVGSSNFSL